MKSIMTKSIITMLFVILSCLNIYSQQKKNYRTEIPAPVKTDKSVLKDLQNQSPVSEDIIDFQNRMKVAKESGNREEILRLQRESDRVTGSFTAAPPRLEVSKMNIEEDQIAARVISNSNSRIILGMATCTEQTGNNTGRIWAINSYYPNSPPFILDGMEINFSDDNGITWNNFGFYSFGQNIYIGNDNQLDAELIISSDNEKYLWVVYKADVGLINNIKAGLFILNLNNAADFNNYFLNWPGGSNVYYKTPRIVSDNSQYPDLAFTYIVASIDSSATGNPITSPGVFGEKVAVCYDPYTTSPLISYRARPFMRTLTGYTHNPGLEHFNCDIAYYRNGGQDSIILIETGLETSSSIALGRTSVVTFLSGNPYDVYYGTINVNSNKRTRGFIASNGAYNKLMISVNYEFSSTDHDIEYYRSTDGSGNWLRGFIDIDANDAISDAEVVGQRNVPGKFAVAFNTNNPVQLNYFQSDSYIWSSGSSINFSHLNSHWSNPKAGIRLNSGSNNCFSIWADTTRRTLWSSAGCTGPVVSNAKLLISAAIEGLYDPDTEAIIPDTVRLYLRNAFSPYDIVDSSTGVLSTLASNVFLFSNAPYNVPLYIQVRHRNALESWSSVPVIFKSFEKTYSFLIQSNTYGSNSKQINFNYPIYGFYSGDVNQDGTIDLTDGSLIDNDAINFASGYLKTDLNGDGIIDVADAVFADNNAFNFVGRITP